MAGKAHFCGVSVVLHAAVEYGGALESCMWYAWQSLMEEG